jgi:hypothetical protein
MPCDFNRSWLGFGSVAAAPHRQGGAGVSYIPFKIDKSASDIATVATVATLEKQSIKSDGYEEKTVACSKNGLATLGDSSKFAIPKCRNIVAAPKNSIATDLDKQVNDIANEFLTVATVATVAGVDDQKHELPKSYDILADQPRFDLELAELRAANAAIYASPKPWRLKP